MLELTEPEVDVGLATLDADGACAFYRDVIGLPTWPAPQAAAGALTRSLRVGGHTLTLRTFDPPPARREGGTGAAIGMRLLAFLLDDLEGVLSRMDEAGHAYRRLGLPSGAPFQVAFSEDADGNALELVGLGRPAGEALSARLQVGLTVSDIARSRRFYGELLGLREEPEMKLPRSMGVVGNTRYGFLLGRTTVKFWRVEGALPTWSGAPERCTGIRVLTGHVADVDATHRDLRDRGVPIVAPPADREGVGRSMAIADPDGNRIELVTPG